MNVNGQVYFLGNRLEIDCAFPAEIDDDIRLDRPPPKHRTWYSQYLHERAEGGGIEFLYAHEWAEQQIIKNLPPGSDEFVPLDPKDWKYVAVLAKGNGLAAQNFFMAANLASVPIWSATHVMTSEPFGEGQLQGWGSDPFQATARLLPAIFEAHLDAPSFTDKSVGELRDVWKVFRALDRERYLDIYSAVEALYHLNSVPPQSSLLVLGHFAVLEMLLTHSPKIQGNDDSISHQLRTKIALVEDRLPTRLDYARFQGRTPDQVWSALYSYRSAIAHGTRVNFAHKDLRAAFSKDAADQFIYSGTRAILRAALREPMLFEALKPI